jgi:hypothetical protein
LDRAAMHLSCPQLKHKADRVGKLFFQEAKRGQAMACPRRGAVSLWVQSWG